MKRCPECRRDYYDDSLMYCLDDGNVLLEGPGAGYPSAPASYRVEPETMVISKNGALLEVGTQVLTADPIDNTGAIAVLPFTNMSPDGDAEYLSDGLAEEVLNVLTRIQGLRVAGRTSSFSFKGKQSTIKEVGQQLNVSSVLEGSVRMAGKRVRISVQLVNVADGYRLWSETYDRTLDDIFAIQDDIAGSVVEEVRSRLIDEPNPSLNRQIAAEVADAARGRTDNPEAHRLMLLARHLGERRTAEDMAAAVKYFEESLAIDPNNARCWVELGLVQSVRAGLGLVPYSDAYNDALRSVERSLAIETDLAAGHAVLARIYLSHLVDFERTDTSIRRALEIAPEDPFVLAAAAFPVRILGRPQDALEIARKAVTLDPLNPVALGSLCSMAYFAGELRESETAGRRALEISPERVLTHSQLAMTLLADGRIEEARDEVAEEPDEFWRLYATAFVENLAGRRDAAVAALERLVSTDSEESPFQIAEICAGLGRIDEAYRYLELGIGKDPGIATITSSPHLRPLHTDARWEPLLRKIGIPEQYWPTT